MLLSARGASIAQRALGGVAMLFGALTLVAGGRVLLGADPGYLVYRPLLVFNTLMGLAYLAGGVLMLRQARAALATAAVIVLLNLLALAGVLWLQSHGGAVAVESVRAMGFRAGLWLVLLLALAWLQRGTAGRPA